MAKSYAVYECNVSCGTESSNPFALALSQQRTGAGRSDHETQAEDPLHNQDQQPDDDDLRLTDARYRLRLDRLAVPQTI